MKEPPGGYIPSVLDFLPPLSRNWLEASEEMGHEDPWVLGVESDLGNSLEISDSSCSPYMCLINFLQHDCKDKIIEDLPEDLSGSLTIAEADDIYSILCWYTVIMHGKLPEHNNLKNLKDILGIGCLAELLVDKVCNCVPGIWSLENLSILLSQDLSQHIGQTDDLYSQVTQKIVEKLIEDCESTIILERIQSYFEFDSSADFSKYQKAIESLDVFNRLRWKIFVILAPTYLVKGGEGITVKPGIYPQGIPESLLPLVNSIDIQLVELRRISQPRRVNRRLDFDSPIAGLDSYTYGFHHSSADQ